ncbi:hydrolase, partial [Cronobacter sakazakii]
MTRVEGDAMSLTHWQQRFEDWLHQSWNQDDK